MVMGILKRESKSIGYYAIFHAASAVKNNEKPDGFTVVFRGAFFVSCWVEVLECRFS